MLIHPYMPTVLKCYIICRIHRNGKHVNAQTSSHVQTPVHIFTPLPQSHSSGRSHSTRFRDKSSPAVIGAVKIQQKRFCKWQMHCLRSSHLTFHPVCSHPSPPASFLFFYFLLLWRFCLGNSGVSHGLPSPQPKPEHGDAGR